MIKRPWIRRNKRSGSQKETRQKGETDDRMVRMLHIAGSMSPSGIGNFIMNAYRNVDRSRVQFDFIVCEHREVSFDEEIRALGGRVFYVTRKSVSPIKNFNEIRKIVRDGHYRFVFRHTDVSTVALDLFAAKLGGASERIAHSHSTSAKKIWIHKLFRPFLNAVCTQRFACSADAGRWMYGNHKKYRIIMNGIDIPQYLYDGKKREKMREEFGFAQDVPVLGHVGNYMPVKNHALMIEAFAKVRKKYPDSRLIFVGDGDLREQMERRIRELELGDSVILTGVRNDIPDVLQAMDLFLFPSLYEGMPIALVEAQTAGLPCVISDAVTPDVCVTDPILRVSPDAGAEGFADAVIHMLDLCEQQERTRMRGTPAVRNEIAMKISDAGFDVKKLGEVYDRLAQ